MELRDRLMDKVQMEPNSGCWLWVGSTNQGGYGNMTVDGKFKSAHRASYELFVCGIPDGLDLDHLCRVRCCVNPEHLEPVTRSVNSKRGITGHHLRAKAALITHCPHGHEYTPANTRMNRGKRQCIECAHARHKVWRDNHPGYMAATAKRWRDAQQARA